MTLILLIVHTVYQLIVSISHQVSGGPTPLRSRTQTFSSRLWGSLHFSNVCVVVCLWVCAGVMWMTIWRCVLSPRYPTPFCCVVMAKRQNTFQQTPVYTTKTTLALSILYCSNANTGTQRASGAPTKPHAVPSACMMSSFWPLEWVWGLVWPTLFFYIILFFTQRRFINFLPCDWHCFRSWRQSSEQNWPSLT